MASILSLPVLKDVSECADFSLTVQPYIHQLYSLPSQVASIASSDSKLDALSALYLNTNPLITGLFISLALAPIFLVLSEINRNYSQVDRLWSILPGAYVAHFAAFAHLNGLPTQKLDNVLVFSTMWGARLTYNFWRKGGYQIGNEDYRWEVVKARIGPVGMFVLNVVFISTIQSILLFAITTPAYILMLTSRFPGGDKMDIFDIVFSRVLMALILVEVFADQQQWNYQQAKAAYLKTAKVPQGSQYTQEDLDRGFVTIWLALYQWGCTSSSTFLNWTLVGAFSYLMVFQGSTPLGEKISAGKYPEYKDYQRLVGRFLPKLMPVGAKGDSVPEKLVTMKQAGGKKLK
ncbi:hypothetical protein EG328_000515 [Venturia inaequalis]|uniref:DUF1295-domain-containing protein n=2 Tax=Venturia inaequalis TaxID=5025 RepID=A0A8H3YZJ6_VENIN|nr:hypothetical protein EG328_000515 [Venturia inaequalis]KAE9992945.1 hypothetical protein EG327_007253 [Venturia inaequalis]